MEIILRTKEYWWDTYLKRFFKKEPFDLENKNFLGDKIIKKYIKEIKEYWENSKKK